MAVDYSVTLGPVRDQGHRSTCLAFAATAAHESARARQRGQPMDDLSEEMIYWCSKARDGDPSPGTTPSGIAAALSCDGQVPAHLWPYEIHRDDTAPAPTVPAEAQNPVHARKASMHELTCDAASVGGALAAGRLVVLGLKLWPGFFSPVAGWVNAPTAADLMGDAHAVVAVGFDRDSSSLLIRNSWGPTWGVRGHARMSLDGLPIAGLGAWTVDDDIDPVAQ